MEGTDATGTLPKRQHSSATPSPRATYTPSSKTMVPSGNTMVSQLEFMSNWMDLGICLRWRGRVRLEPCQIGSTRPRRQARGRRSLHPFKSIRFDMFHSLTNMWRFGFGVRENAGKGGKKKRCETMYGKAIFHNVFPKCVSQCSVGADPPLRPEEEK